MSHHLRLGALLFFSAPLVLSGCYIRASLPVIPPEVADTCPDFSGAYYFPGGKNSAGVCSVLNGPHHPQGAAFRWPHPESGFAELRSPAMIRLEQVGCQSLQFEILRSSSGTLFAIQSSRDLVRRRRRTRVTWTQDSLTYSDRIKPAPSFTLAPLNAAREEFFLQLVNGSLVYRATYWEATEGWRTLTECTLPSATEEDWESVGLAAWRDQ